MFRNASGSSASWARLVYRARGLGHGTTLCLNTSRCRVQACEAARLAFVAADQRVLQSGLPLGLH